METTYLHACLKDDRTVRWPESAMPLRVYVAPFTWYERNKQQQSDAYRQMCLNAFSTWAQATGGKFSYRIVPSLQESQIDINWRRVDRNSLGHCEYIVNDKSFLYSAEISIGISDGVIHAGYNDIGEVQHTILHEIGHALGIIGHSDGAGDMMYVPHQYGVTQLSNRDLETIKVLYDLPVGFHYKQAAEQLAMVAPYTFSDVVSAMRGGPKGALSNQPSNVGPNPADIAVLNTHHDILTYMGKFHMATQHLRKGVALGRPVQAPVQAPVVKIPNASDPTLVTHHAFRKPV